MGGVTPHGEGEGADRHIKCGIDVQEGKGLWARDVEEGMGSGFTRRDGLRVRAVGEGVGSRLMHWFVILGMVGLFTEISMCVVFFVLHYHLGCSIERRWFQAQFSGYGLVWLGPTAVGDSG